MRRRTRCSTSRSGAIRTGLPSQPLQTVWLLCWSRQSIEKDPQTKPLSDRRATLAAWCDQNLGTRIADQINRESIKWCEAFLDEGHATWPMPGREKGFYRAWKFLAEREWSTLRN